MKVIRKLDGSLGHKPSAGVEHQLHLWDTGKLCPRSYSPAPGNIAIIIVIRIIVIRISKQLA